MQWSDGGAKSDSIEARVADALRLRWPHAQKRPHTDSYSHTTSINVNIDYAKLAMPNPLVNGAPAPSDAH
jgi:hypothetical protein